MRTSKYIIPLLFSLIGSNLLAQSPLENADANIEASESLFKTNEDGPTELPKFHEEEDVDLGPQYLLVPGTAAHKWFTAMVDFQWMRTTNPTLDTGSNSETSDLAVATGQLGVITPEKPLLGGNVSASGGARYQLFRYGTLDHTEIAGAPVDQNDFEGYSLFSNLTWRKDDWQVGAGLRWTELDNDVQGDGFFEEFVPTWHVSRDLLLNADTKLQVKYDGAYYFTESTAFLTQFDDLNDRLANSLSMMILHRINSKLYVQPSARVTYSVYQNNNTGDREDTVIRIGTAFTYYLHSNIQLRLFTGYQKRKSTGLGIVEYDNWDLGVGSSLSARF